MASESLLKPSLRNLIAQRLANLALRIATPTYRAMILGAIEYGLRSAARDEMQGRTSPEDWKSPDARARWTHGDGYK